MNRKPSALKWASRAAVIVALASPLAPTNAVAISTYISTSKSCGTLKSYIQNQGAVILRWTSPRTGNPIYNRYVRNASYCNVGQTTQSKFIPAADTGKCRVFYCVQRERNCDFMLDC